LTTEINVEGLGRGYGDEGESEIERDRGKEGERGSREGGRERRREGGEEGGGEDCCTQLVSEYKSSEVALNWIGVVTNSSYGH
jgi:hypothetical protein